MIIFKYSIIYFNIYKVGKEVAIKGICGTVILSIFIDLLEKFNPLTEDRFLACIYGGILSGLGTAIVLKASASTEEQIY